MAQFCRCIREEQKARLTFRDPYRETAAGATTIFEFASLHRGEHGYYLRSNNRRIDCLTAWWALSEEGTTPGSALPEFAPGENDFSTDDTVNRSDS